MRRFLFATAALVAFAAPADASDEPTPQFCFATLSQYRALVSKLTSYENWNVFSALWNDEFMPMKEASVYNASFIDDILG